MSNKNEADSNVSRIRFDGTITLGNLLTLLSMLGTILLFFRNIETRVIVVEEKQKAQIAMVERLVAVTDNLIKLQVGTDVP